ncbi:hypothetical protein AVEN_20880-1 [Araneus ventricosus]|uniref:Uncharacterized protein n=1 Tax=Araneus ventricosus TaxID=182803 RepID=A0A4Y2KLZ7_ARAVE|nr:hypothetical protein AVEN_20880-1 [Araneus ventricosus]
MATDESTFTREGMFNSHNFHVWSEENPPRTVFSKCMGRHRRRPPRRRTVLVARTSDRCKLSDLPSSSIAAAVGRRTYPLLCVLPCGFSMMGPPAHYSIDVRLHLNVTYGQQWTGRGGPVLRPARSPDLTYLDYF